MINSLNNKQVFVCETLYHLFIALVLSKKAPGSMLVLTDFTNGMNHYADKIFDEGIFNHVLYLPNRSKCQPKFNQYSIFYTTFFRSAAIQKAINENSEILKYHDYIKECDINLFFNLGLVCAYFVTTFPYNYIRMIEDGERNYISRLGKLKIFKRKYIYHSFIGEGLDKEIREIHVQRPSELPNRIRHKGVNFDLYSLVNHITKEDIKQILHIFSLDRLNKLELHEGTLLITQPLSEDRFISESDKIEMYKKVLKENTNDKNIIIKTHPREKTDYFTYFNEDITVLPKDFPLELLNFVPGLRLKKRSQFGQEQLII